MLRSNDADATVLLQIDITQGLWIVFLLTMLSVILGEVERRVGATLLALLDGIAATSGIAIIACTNRYSSNS